MFRFEQYKKNIDIIGTHNANNENTFHLGPNQFTDMTHDEYKRLLGYRPQAKANAMYATFDYSGIPE
jgi:hypothetical protein